MNIPKQENVRFSRLESIPIPGMAQTLSISGNPGNSDLNNKVIKYNQLLSRRSGVTPQRLGWLCPVCKTVWSPDIISCECTTPGKING